MSDSVAVLPPSVPQLELDRNHPYYEDRESPLPPPPPPTAPPPAPPSDYYQDENLSTSYSLPSIAQKSSYNLTIMNGSFPDHQLQVIDTDRPATELDSSIEELLNTLECPICLDTADQPPIYQCPEGHLLCESCNSHLKDCPQCGHALMNSRNRTAEELADKLQTLKARGSAIPEGASAPFFPSQSLTISVYEPQKSRKGIMLVISYTIKTLVKQDRLYPSLRPNAVGIRSEAGDPKQYTVSRTYGDVKKIYNWLIREYQNDGIIVPYPPELGSNAMTTASTVAVASMTRDDSLTTSVVTDKRCLALARYLNRMARHPIIKKDPTFRAFLQETDVPKSLKAPRTTAKDRWIKIKERILIFRSRLTVKEHDPWFQTRSSQLEEVGKRLTLIKKNLKIMSSLKGRLSLTSTAFRQNLVLLLVSRPSKEKDLRHIVHQAINCHKVMETVHQDQSQADEMILQLATDYVLQVKAAQEVLSCRTYMQHEVQRVKSLRAGKAAKSASKQNSQAEDEEEDEEDEDDDDESDAESETEEESAARSAQSSGSKEIRKMQKRFKNVSQNIRRELEHFDFVMKEEFEEAFSSYNFRYFKAMSSSPKATRRGLKSAPPQSIQDHFNGPEEETTEELE